MVKFFQRHIIETYVILGFLLTMLTVFVQPWQTDNNKADVVRAQNECKDFGGIFIMTTRQAEFGTNTETRYVSVVCNDHLALKWEYKE